MEKVTAENFINLLKEKFPKFIPYWDSYVNYWGMNQGITIQMIPFSEYVVDVIKTNNIIEIKNIFDFVEFLLCNGDESIQNAVATSFLEYLLNKAPDEIKFNVFAKYLGENTIKYCKAWDEFTGIKTKGLWEN